MDHIVALCAPLFRTQPPQAIPPPSWAAPLPTGCWVHFQHSLSASSQWQWICLFVLFLCLVSMCPSVLPLCSLCFLYHCQCLVFLLSCVLVPLISSAVFLCPCLCLSAIRVIWQCPYWFGGSYPAGPTQVRRQSVRVVTSLLEVYIGGVQAVIS